MPRSIFDFLQADDPNPSGLPSGLDRTPFDEAKKSLTESTYGRASLAAKGTQARLASHGVGDIPGVAESVATTQRAASQSALNPALANIDLNFAKENQAFKERRAQFNAQLNQIQTARNRSDFSTVLSGIIKLGSFLIPGGPLIALGADAAIGEFSNSDQSRDILSGIERNHAAILEAKMNAGNGRLPWEQFR